LIGLNTFVKCITSSETYKEIQAKEDEQEKEDAM
jgi:hypothetical protein